MLTSFSAPTLSAFNCLQYHVASEGPRPVNKAIPCSMGYTLFLLTSTKLQASSHAAQTGYKYSLCTVHYLYKQIQDVHKCTCTVTSLSPHKLMFPFCYFFVVMCVCLFCFSPVQRPSRCAVSPHTATVSLLGPWVASRTPWTLSLTACHQRSSPGPEQEHSKEEWAI